jgi:hypothetical protein
MYEREKKKKKSKTLKFNLGTWAQPEEESSGSWLTNDEGGGGESLRLRGLDGDSEREGREYEWNNAETTHVCTRMRAYMFARGLKTAWRSIQTQRFSNGIQAAAFICPL